MEVTRQIDSRQPACILVPLDGSTMAEASLSYVPLFVRPEGLGVELLVVRETADSRASLEEPKAYLQDRVTGLWADFGVRATGEIQHGIPFLAILYEAQAEDVSMIIMSTHGHTGPAQWRLGSVADKVIRDAPCPILVIGPSCAPGPAELRRVLVPLDGSELAEIALPMAGGMAKNLGVMVELVRIVGPDSIIEERQEQQTASMSEAAAIEYLEGIAQKLPAGVTVKLTVLHGPAAKTLLNHIQDTSPDLLVMSSHGGHGFFSYALGSVTDRMLACSVPVLIVRPGHLQRIKALFPD